MLGVGFEIPVLGKGSLAKRRCLSCVHGRLSGSWVSAYVPDVAQDVRAAGFRA